MPLSQSRVYDCRYVDRLCFEYLFSCLCVDNVITLMGHMLCNRSIIFVAEHLSLLAPVCEALCALLHPYVTHPIRRKEYFRRFSKYLVTSCHALMAGCQRVVIACLFCNIALLRYDCTSIYIPYLPKSLFGLLSSPVNFMVGVLKEDFVDKSMKQQRANLSCYVVWLGKDKVQYWHEGHPPTEDAVEGHPTLPINLHEVCLASKVVLFCLFALRRLRNLCVELVLTNPLLPRLLCDIISQSGP